MLKARLNAESAVRTDLILAEEAIDQAVQRVASLLNTMCVARTTANLPMFTAQDEFEQISKAVSMAGQARACILAAHQSFVATRAAVLPTVSWGDESQCPPGSAGFMADPIQPLLRAVG